jgi:hypothetical protein
MASDLKISTAARDALVDAFTALIDGGTGAGRIEIRTGSPPTDVDDASTGTLLGTLTFQADSYSASSGGTATVTPSINSDTDANDSGDAGYFRVYAGAAGDTAALLQGTCGEAADAPVDLEFDEKTIVAGGTIAISALSLTMPIQ